MAERIQARQGFGMISTIDTATDSPLSFYPVETARRDSEAAVKHEIGFAAALGVVDVAIMTANSFALQTNFEGLFIASSSLGIMAAVYTAVEFSTIDRVSEERDRIGELLDRAQIEHPQSELPHYGGARAKHLIKPRNP